MLARILFTEYNCIYQELPTRAPQEGLVHWKIIDGGLTQDLFAEFLSELSVLFPEHMTIVFDNARAHLNSPALGEGQDHKHLSPYSPFLNMDEQSISVVKADLKRRISSPAVQGEIQNRQAAIESGSTLSAWRKNILRREIEAAIPAMTKEKAFAQFMHTLTYATKCLSLQDIWN